MAQEILKYPSAEPDLAELLHLLADCARNRASWRDRQRALLEEHDRLEVREQHLLAAALQRIQLDNAAGQGRSNLKRLVESYERTVIRWALASAGGQQNRAAAALGIKPTTLNEKIKRLGITL